MAGEASDQLPRRPLNQWHYILSLNSTTSGGNESTILRPRKAPIDRHAHRLLKIRANLGFHCYVFVILDSPNFDTLFFTRLAGQEFTEWVETEAICF